MIAQFDFHTDKLISIADPSFLSPFSKPDSKSFVIEVVYLGPVFERAVIASGCHFFRCLQQFVSVNHSQLPVAWSYRSWSRWVLKYSRSLVEYPQSPQR